MLIEVTAKFTCDECGNRFSVNIADHAYQPPAGWSVFDIAEDAIRGGFGYQPTSRSRYVGMVENNRHLCGDCAAEVCKSDPECSNVILQ